MLTVLVWVGEGHLRILSANISTLGPQAEGFLRSHEMGRFQTVALAEHHVGANSINKLDKLWRQTGFRGTAATTKKISEFDQWHIWRHVHGHAKLRGDGRWE